MRWPRPRRPIGLDDVPRIHPWSGAPRRVAVTVAVVGALVALPTPAVAAGSPVVGGGPQPTAFEFNQWATQTAGAPSSLQVSFAATRDRASLDNYIQSSVDFAASALPFQADQQNALQASGRGAFVYVPVSADAVGFMFNVTGTDAKPIAALQLSPRTACRIFTLAGIRWNDPSIVADNPGVPLPSTEIKRVVRSDVAATSLTLSQYCQAVAADVWTAFVSFMTANDTNNSLRPDFKSGGPTAVFPMLGTAAQGAIVAEAGSDGVAATVGGGSQPDSIGYLEPYFARNRGAALAAVKNASGTYVSPDTSAVTAAVPFASSQTDGTYLMSFASVSGNAYGPTMLDYAIAQTTGLDPNKGDTLSKYLSYAVSSGQGFVEPLGLGRLSDALSKVALDRIGHINTASSTAAPSPNPPTSIPELPTAFPLVLLASGATAWVVVHRCRARHRRAST